MSESLDELGLPRSKSFSEIGLPQHYVTALTFHEFTRTVIVHLGPQKDQPVGKRLFFRWGEEANYTQIGDFPEDIAIDSFALDQSCPSLYFLTIKWKKLDSGMGGDWDALYRFDLDEHRCEMLIQAHDLQPPVSFERACLMELLSVSADGGSIICNVGLESPVLHSPLPGCRRMDYWVTKLHLADRKLEPLIQLEATFA